MKNDAATKIVETSGSSPQYGWSCWVLAICRVAALAAVAEGTIRYVASDDLRRSGKNDFSMHWLFGERFFSFCS